VTKEEIIREAENIQGWMSHDELSIIYDLASEVLKKDSLAVEVGSWKGRSSYVIGNVCQEKGARLICIDTFNGCDSQKELFIEVKEVGISRFMDENIKKNLAGLPVDYIIGNSTEVYTQIVDNSASFVFIDGDHFNPVVKQDLDNYWPKVKTGGIFSGHDHIGCFPDVIKEVNLKFPDIIQREIKHDIWIIRK
jgi:predicted O-methyltransferase YrrM